MPLILTEQDRATMTAIEAGESITSIDSDANTYKALISKILFQFADSQLAGSAGYSSCARLAPSIDDRVTISQLAHEKNLMARQVYSLVENVFGINLAKYLHSHSWEMRFNRRAHLGYSRSVSDKRLNALLYPLENWSDVAVFTYLMASMASLQLKDFAQGSYSPWASLATKFVPIEDSHKLGGQTMIERLCVDADERLSAQSSLNYWYSRVKQSFGPPSGEGNKLHRMFGLRAHTNDELLQKWRNDATQLCQSVELALDDSEC